MVSCFCWFYRLELKLNKLPFNSTQLSAITLCKQTWLKIFSFQKGEKWEDLLHKQVVFSQSVINVLLWKSYIIAYYTINNIMFHYRHIKMFQAIIVSTPIWAKLYFWYITMFHTGLNVCAVSAPRLTKVSTLLFIWFLLCYIFLLQRR